MGSRNGVDAEIGRDEEEDDCDPQYRLFIQNLKPCGSAYVLELERGNDTEIIKFEDEDEDELQSPNQRRREVPRPKLEPCGNAGVLGLARGNTNDTKIVNLGDGDEDQKVPKPVSRHSPIARRCDGGVHGEMKSLEIDCGQLQQQRMSCRYVGESSKSVPRITGYGKHPNWRRFSRGSPIEFRVVNERSADLDMGKIHRQGRVVAGNLSRRGGRLNRNPPVVNEGCDGLDKGKSRRQGCVVSGNLSRKRGRPYENPPVVNEGCGGGLDKGKSRREGHVVSRRRGRLNANPPEQRSNGRRGKERVQTVDRDKIDKTYYMFISGLINTRHVLVYQRKDGKQCRYNKKTNDRRSDPDAGGSPKPPPSSGRMTPKPNSKRVAPSDKRVPSKPSVKGSDSEFRQHVMDILLKPFDQKEYDDLLKEAKRRAPQQRSRELRGRSFYYPDESKMGKSYLDYHRDLDKKLGAVKRDDPHKALHLLRGFFFYMQHPCMEGLFQPWNDDLWLEAMNRST